MPDSSNRPEHRYTSTADLSLVLWRLDSIDRNMSRLVTTEAHHALESRVARIEQHDRDDDEFKRQITGGVVIAFLGALGSIVLTVIGG